MTTAVQQIKHLLNLSSFEGYNGLLSHIEKLVKERDEALQLREAYNSNVKDWRELCGYFNLPVSSLSDVLSVIDTMRKERGVVQGTINGLKQLLELPESTGLTELFNAVEALELNKPQLSEIRYVLHGDIQPCSVLYSDDTTTLLRLDEGDMMLETDTIEWSDSVTYRCQELVADAMGVHGRAVNQRTLRAVAQLVRDERILLNDNGDDALSRPAVVIPKPSLVKPIPSCNNPYVHTNTAYLEEPMRTAGWTTEELVQNGYGHYVPVQHPADPSLTTADPSDIPFVRHSPVQER